MVGGWCWGPWCLTKRSGDVFTVRARVTVPHCVQHKYVDNSCTDFRGLTDSNTNCIARCVQENN